MAKKKRSRKKQYKKKKGQKVNQTVLKNFRVTIKQNLTLNDKAKEFFGGNESKFLRDAIQHYKPKYKLDL